MTFLVSCTGGGPGVFSQSKDVDDSRQERNDGLADNEGAVTGKILWDGRAKQVLNMTSGGALKGGSITFEISPLSENANVTFVEGTTMTGTESKEALSRSFWKPAAATSSFIVDSDEAIDGEREFTIRVPILADVVRGIDLQSDSFAIVYKQIRQDQGGRTFYGLMPRSGFKIDAEKMTLRTRYFGQYQLVYLDSEVVAADEIVTTNRICRKSQQVTSLNVLDAPTEAIEGWVFEPAVRVSLSASAAKGSGESSITKCYNGYVTITPYGLKSSDDLTGTLKVYPVDGVATFNDLQINSLAKDVALNIQDWDGIQVATPSFDVFEKPADKLSFVSQPVDIVAGQAMADITIESMNEDGKVDPRFAREVELKATAASKPVTLKGTTKVKAVKGIVTFKGVSIEKANADVKLSVVANLIKESFSKTFTVSHAAPSKLKVTSQPASGLKYGDAFSVTVESLDAYDNITTSTSESVTTALSVNSVGATLSGTTSKALTAGVAAFTGLSLNKPATDYMLSFAMNGVTAVNSDAFRMKTYPASKLIWEIHPATSTAATAFSSSLKVRALDNNDHLDTDFVGSVTMAIGTNPGSSTLSGTTSVAAVAGVSTHAGLSLNKSGSNYTLVASSSSLISATSNPFNINAGSFSSLTFAIQPANAIINQTMGGVKVRALDSSGNIVSTYTGQVALTIATDPPSGTTLTGGTAVNMSGGEHTFSSLALNKVGQGFVLRATSGSTTVNSSTFNVAASLVGDQAIDESNADEVSDLSEQTCGGDGSQETPYRICIPSHLKMMRQFPTAYFELQHDISLKALSDDQLLAIFPLSSIGAPFMGVFRGRGHRVIGSEKVMSSPIWGELLEAQIQNVGFVNLHVRSCSESGLVAQSIRHSIIEDIVVNGRIHRTGCLGPMNDEGSGAIAGHASDSTVRRVIIVVNDGIDFNRETAIGRAEGRMVQSGIRVLGSSVNIGADSDASQSSASQRAEQVASDLVQCSANESRLILPRGSGSESYPFVLCTAEQFVWATQQQGAYAQLFSDMELLEVVDVANVFAMKLRSIDGRGYSVRHAMKWGARSKEYFESVDSQMHQDLIWQNVMWMDVPVGGASWLNPASGTMVSDVRLSGGMVMFASDGSCAERFIQLVPEGLGALHLDLMSEGIAVFCGNDP